MTVAVQVERVSKCYRLGVGRRSLREAVSDLVGRTLGRSGAGDPDNQVIWALRDVDFQVRRGEALGIIGPNGAGKTTVLKLLSRVTQPTKGEIEIRGRVSALIELGAGFHPDLTGRENIYLNGVILGLSRQEISHKFDNIVAFSGLERFIDTPVKRYSSGMYARLGFSVAVHADPDILLVDEVLAVGDGAFQRKCHERMRMLMNGGVTVVFVSHNLIAVERLCNRAIWLKGGCIQSEGKPSDVIGEYLDAMDLATAPTPTMGSIISGQLQILQVRTTNASGRATTEFIPGEDVMIEVHYRAEKEIVHPHFALGIGRGGEGPLFLASMLLDGQAPSVITGDGFLRCRFKDVPLMPGAYKLFGEVWGAEGYDLIVPWKVWGGFRVVEDFRNVPYLERNEQKSISHLKGDAPIYVSYAWEFEQTT